MSYAVQRMGALAMSLLFLPIIFSPGSVRAAQGANQASGGNRVTTPLLEREILLDQEDAPVLEPQVAERTRDGGFIVAGKGNRRPNGGVAAGGAAKYDTNGKEVWRYSTSLRESLSPRPDSPEFFGAAPMPDGSTFLCGEMPHTVPAKTEASWAMLTHLDANGHLISENLISPPQKTGKITSLVVQYFHNCVAWGNGVANIGTAIYRKNAVGTGIDPSSEVNYWLIALDDKGNQRWEKTIPTGEKLLSQPAQELTWFSASNIALLSLGPDLVFSATNGSDTEVIRLSSSGEVEAHAQFVGNYRLVRPVIPDDVIQL